MANRSAIGPIMVLVVGLLIVLGSVLWFVGVDLASMISVWATSFGDFMGNWGTSFGEFFSTWGEGLEGLLTGIFSLSILQWIGGGALVVAGLVIIGFAINSLRK